MTTSNRGTDPAPLFRLEDSAIRCPYPAYDRMRDESAAWWSDELGAFVVTRAADAEAILRDPVTYSSRQATGPASAERAARLTAAAGDLAPELGRVMANRHPGLLLADPPEHASMRGLVNRAFSPRQVRLLEPFIERLTHELIDRFIHRGRVDFLHEFAVPLPIAVIAHALGVPDADLDAMKQWSKDLVILIGNTEPTRADIAAFITANDTFESYVGGLIDERRRSPTDDLLGALATAETDGSLLDRAVLLDLVRQFVTAGHDTTTALLTAAMHRLATDHVLLGALRDAPERIPTFAEEMLRLESPIQGLYRRATEDTNVGDVTVPAGQHVLVLYGACNRDPAAHDDPGDTRLDRPAPSRHLAFGQGEHFCVGAALARTEARIALGAIVERLGPLSPVVEGDVSFQRSFLLRGMEDLVVTFDPGKGKGIARG